MSTLAGCASDLFSDASDAAVTCAIMKPLFRPGSAREERRQARDAGVDQHRDAALGDRADLGDRDRHRVGGERHRLGVEVAAGDAARRASRRTPAGCRSPRWPRAPAPAPRGAAGRGRRPPPAAGSAGCTGPARGRRPRGASGGSRCRRAARGSSCATSICPGWPRSAWMRGSNGPSLPRAASTVSAPITSAASSTGSNASSACSASAVETCVPLISARPSLAASVSGAMPASRSAAAAGTRSPSTSISPSPISASVRCASGARSPEAPTEPWHGTYGHQAGVVHREQRVDHRLAHARVAAREARRLEREHQPHHRRLQRLADADACASGSG